MKLENKNIFLSCACTNPVDYTVFTGRQRLDHLLKTVDSCRQVSDSINVISEGSDLTSDQYEELSKVALVLTYTDEIVKLSIQNKQKGSIIVWIKALEQMEVPEDSNIFFLSGRYTLTSDFDENLFISDYTFKKHWYEKGRGGWYGTQLFKISGSKLKEFTQILYECIDRISNGTAQDLECAIYQSLIARNIQPHELELVNCQGLLGPTGHLEIH